MIYLDILHNGYESLLYVNGKASNDIDDTWIDCLKFIEKILNDKIKVRVRQTDKEYKDFPKVIENYKDSDIIWRKITFNELQKCIQDKKTLKYKYKDTELVIKSNEIHSNLVSFDMLCNGQWYVLE